MNIELISSTEAACWQNKQLGLPNSTKAATLKITHQEHQTIKGFGGCFNELGWKALSQLSEDDRKQAIDALFSEEDGCGFTFCRVPIGASDYATEWYSCNETDNDLSMKNFTIERDKQCLIPYIKEAQQRQPDLSLFASPWSPPTWMKTFRTFNYGNMRWEKPILDAYALYFKKFVEAYGSEGINVEQVHVQNEPQSNQKFPSCVWTGEQMRDFIRDHIGPLFKKENVDCEIWAGTIEKGVEHGWLPNEVGTQSYARWAHTILSDPEAREFVSGIGLQWDGKGTLQQTHLTWPDVPIIQTENECGDGNNTWQYALYVFSLMWNYFVNGTVAYIYWNMVLPEGGESTWGWHQNAMINVTEDNKLVFNPEYYAMRHFAGFVNPGAKRIGTAGEWTAFTLCFKNQDGSTVVVICNPFDHQREVVFEYDGNSYELQLDAKSFNTIKL